MDKWERRAKKLEKRKQIMREHGRGLKEQQNIEETIVRKLRREKEQYKQEQLEKIRNQ